MDSFTRAEIAKAKYVLEQVRQDWLSRPDVTAVSLGYRWTDGEVQQELCVRVHVAQKRPLHKLSDSEIFPAKLLSVPVDVIEGIYDIISLQDVVDVPQLEIAAARLYDRFYETIPLGVSIGNPFVSAGTLGALVIDDATGDKMILSNWHVLAGSLDAQTGTPIWQPGSLDGGSESDLIATLDRWVLDPYDAAVARLTGDRDVMSRTLEGETIGQAAAPELGMTVWKSGRTSGRSQGFVDGIEMSVPMIYPNGRVVIEDVCNIVPLPDAPKTELSLGGDSGSVWVDEASNAAIGLHFAGESAGDNDYALAMDISAVCRALHVHFPISAPAPIIEPEPEPILAELIDDPMPPLDEILLVPEELDQELDPIPAAQPSNAISLPVPMPVSAPDPEPDLVELIDTPEPPLDEILLAPDKIDQELDPTSIEQLDTILDETNIDIVYEDGALVEESPLRVQDFEHTTSEQPANTIGTTATDKIEPTYTELEPLSTIEDSIEPAPALPEVEEISIVEDIVEPDPPMEILIAPPPSPAVDFSFPDYEEEIIVVSAPQPKPKPTPTPVPVRTPEPPETARAIIEEILAEEKKKQEAKPKRIEKPAVKLPDVDLDAAWGLTRRALGGFFQDLFHHLFVGDRSE